MSYTTSHVQTNRYPQLRPRSPYGRQAQNRADHLPRRSHTVAEEPGKPETDGEHADSDVNLLTPITNEPPLIKLLTYISLTLQQKVRQQIAKQKYPRYGTDPATPRQTNYLEHGRAKANKLRERKHTGLGRGKEGQDALIDVLYENQRGSFLFGGPHYSASSLLPSDPRSWLNKDCTTSIVDICNYALVPGPNWEWACRGWSVDISRDVDEAGWEHSI
ncbi:hypothetical protein LTR91_021507 [Friedmanniomyces endolithicus]|uniref:Uncharacterized protein n=1 Tax=Friedmanniomyces endolithicus TaxID=329885 RepID=A0AAN6HAE6_9PEZI|nr:hypothetical protein LTR57_024628 [Friedmanniomyces endolithicus]KAK0958088.1 hypothetical protein LTR91_021507 [Friedmanniomyces endolithicus]KAK1022166.1 hypothetical protein LTS16_025934 [Friedmanniomyces endolithicus]